ncbi:MAG TPA: alpha/beta hydrolase [Candidatus Cybelea sp.]|jgi:pimeloyl-ACP methyl ester carboxylesterase|nr:alpha/beta hydrolase [Candidatus Cybelea sp.]
MAIFQRSFMYFPSVFSRQQVDAMAHTARMERWTNSTGQFIGMKRLSPRQPAEGTVMITYGNGGTAISCDHYANDIQGVAAFDIFILEYPGYEDRPGRPSQISLFTAADEAFLVLPAKKPVYLVGESLGTGVASYLAGTYSNRIAGLLLISPFNNLADAAQIHFPFLPVFLLLRDRFPSEKYLRNYDGKVGITIDGKDTVVPDKLGYRLLHAYAGPKRLWAFPDGGHCEIKERPLIFWKEVIDFWQSNRPPRRALIVALMMPVLLMGN